MASGTPLLTTRVGEMPEEYWKYCYFINDKTSDGVEQAIKIALQKTEAELCEFGARAKKFAVEQKNYFIMSNKITDFLEKQLIL